MNLPKLYFILDIGLCFKCNMVPEQLCENLLNYGVRLIQLRAKGNPEDFLDIAKKIRVLTKKHGALFIINDHIELVGRTNADGLHIGQDDLPAARARAALSGLILGVSVHSSSEAIKAEQDGADYLGAGPAFHTETKETTPRSFFQLENTISATNLPAYLIGGIKVANLNQLNQLSYYGIAVASTVIAGSNQEQTVKNLNTLLYA